VRAYAWPSLDSAFYTSASDLPATARVLGFAASPGWLVLQSASGAVQWLDVRRNTVLRAGLPLGQAAMLPTGDVVGLDSTGRPVRVSPDGITWRGTVPGPVERLTALADGSLAAFGTGARGPELWRLAPPDTAVAARRSVGRGAVVAGSVAGGRLWLAAPGGVRAVAAATLTDALALDGFPKTAPRALVTTPSGHLALGVYDGTPGVEVVDRDRALHAPSWGLPGLARDLRMDPLGRVVLVRPTQGESAWAVDVASAQVRSTLSTSWRDDLPAVAPDGSVLVVLGPDVSRLDAKTLQRSAVVPGGALDWWLVVTWDGFTASARSDLPPAFAGTSGATPDALDSAIAASEAANATDSTPPAPSPAPPTSPAATTRDSGIAGSPDSGRPAEWFVSFASLVDPARASALAAQLKSGGTAARVMTVAGARGTVYRVVAGPFAARDEAVRAGRSSGREHWITQEP
jgi:cell division septation protein DedD